MLHVVDETWFYRPYRQKKVRATLRTICVYRCKIRRRAVFIRNLKDDKEYILPLTETQHEILFSIETDVYRFEESVSIELEEKLEDRVLREALQQLIDIQPILRAVFRWKGLHEPVMIVLKKVELPIYYQETQMEINIEKEPWFLQVSNDFHKLTLKYSHLIMDGWSLAEFFKELFAFYVQESDMLRKPINTSVKRYASAMKAHDRKREVEFWTKYWDGFSPKLLSESIAKGENQENGTYSCTLSAETMNQLKNYATKHNFAVANIFYATWSVLISSFVRSDDVCIGIISSGRTNDWVSYDSIGMHIKNLPLRVGVQGTFASLCRSIAAQVADIIKNENCTSKEMYGATLIAQRHKLYDSLVVVENYPLDVKQIESQYGINITNIDFHESVSYPFVVQVQMKDELNIQIYQSRDNLRQMLEFLGKSYCFILQQIVDEKFENINEIRVCSYENELIQRFEKSGYQDTSYLNTTLTKIIYEKCNNYSERIAIIDGNETITYEELLKHCRIGYQNLRNLKVWVNTPVAVYMKRSKSLLETIYSIILAGGVYLPISTSVPEERIKYMIDNSGAKLLICNDREDMEKLERMDLSIEIIDYEQMMKADAIVDSISSVNVVNHCDDTAYILYTSGTTGKPKGVEITHRAILNRLYWNSKAIDTVEGDKQLFKTPISFDVSIIEIFQLFFNGHTLVVLPEPYEKMTDQLVEYIQNNHITYIHFIPSMFQQFMQYVATMELQDCLRTLRFIVCSGEVLYADTVNRYYEITKNENTKIINLYGPTEAAVDVSSFVCSLDVKKGIVPIGKPIDNTELRIVDQYMRRVPLYVIGELIILGENLGKGYINNERRTKEFYISTLDGKRCYLTGDLAYWNEAGNITVIGRKDTQIKYNGVRIECDEIRAHVLNSKLVDDAYVMLLKEDNERLVLFYSGKEENSNRVKEVLLKKIPEYMQPSDYCYIRQMPRSLNGKLDAKKLIVYFNEFYKKSSVLIEQEKEMTETECKIADIWSEILGGSVISSRSANFFSCGGNSLMLISMIVEIKKKFGIRVSTQELYNHPVLSSLAEHVKQRVRDTMQLEEKHEENKISFAQRGMAALQLMDQTSTAYNIPILFLIHDFVDIPTLYHAFDTLIREETYLRTVFVVNEGKIEKKKLEYKPLELVNEMIYQEELENIINEFVQPFKLDQPLYRIKFLQTNQGKQYMLFDIHHILCDQNTLQRILQNFQRILAGEKIIRYKEQIEKTWNEELYQKHRQYWNQLFQADQETCLLPKDVYAEQKENRLGHYLFELNGDARQALSRYCKDKATTMFNVLFSAFFVLTFQICKRNNITVGTNYIDDINQSEIGMSLKIVPLRLQLQKTDTLEMILNQNFHRFQEALANGSYTYGELLQDLKDYGTGDDNPLFSMMFIKEEDYFKDSVFTQYFGHVTSIAKSTKFDISLFYHEYSDKIELSFDYNTSSYYETTIQYFAESYLSIVKQFTGNDQIKVQQLSTYAVQHGDLSVQSCFGIRKQLPEVTVQELFDQHCQKYWNNIAIICDHRTIIYGEFFVMTNQIANALQKYDVQDRYVVISLPNSEYLLAAEFGVLKAGGVYVPLDTSFTEERLYYVFHDCQAALMITEKEEKEHEIESITIQQLLSYADDVELCKKHSKDYTYCIYTSGSTGKPKGCNILQKGLLNYLDWANDFYCNNEKKVFAFYTSPAVDMTVTSTLLPLTYGHTVVIYPNEPDSVHKVVQDNRIHIMKATPSHLTLIDETFSKNNGTLESIIVGGEQLTSKLASQTNEKFNYGVKIYNEYGPTETVVGCMIYQYNEKDPYQNVPIGTPIQNTFTVILDEDKRICPAYVKGELYIGGYGLAAGYLNQDELTKEKFQNNCIDESYSSHMYASGDNARRIASGFIEYINRMDNQIKINGHRIELNEISAATEKLDPIEQAIAIVQDGKNGSKQINLYYVEKQGAGWSELTLRNELKRYLPHYMMPLKILRVDQMPLSTSGKIDTKALVNHIIEAPSSQKSSYIDVSEKRQMIMSYLRECVVSIIHNDSFESTDGFFELGFNSLSIIELQRLISRKYEIETMDLFSYPSIYSLCDYLSASTDQEEETEDIQKEEEFAIVGIGFELPGACSIEELHKIFYDGRSMIQYPSGVRYKDEVDKLHIEGYEDKDFKMGMTACLENIDLFAPDYFHIGKDEADVMDPVQRLFMVNIAKALYDAGYEKENLDGKNVAIIAAKPTDSNYTGFIEKYYPDKAQIAQINHVASIMLTRVQHFYNLHGPSYLVDSACSSGLVALSNACNHLQNGDCEIAIVGGVNLIEIVDIRNQKRADVLADSFHANTFSDNAIGTARGEGCISFVIKRLSDAKKDGSKIYAAIKGSSVNNDGFSSSLSAPNGAAQTKVILETLKKAKVDADEIGMVECHGTATALGDPIEIHSLTQAYQLTMSGEQVCALSASKSVFGHLDSIAGLLGVLKFIVCLQYKEIYANFQVTAPNRMIDFMNSPFYLPMTVQKWKANKKNTRICSVNSFGLSGTNVNVILQQWPVQSDEICYCKQAIDLDLGLKRCWVEEQPACTYKKERKSLNKEKNNVDVREEAVLGNLRSKVQKLFSNVDFSVTESMYNLGFDSITIIQLQQFVNSFYGINIEIERLFGELNSLQLLSAYISQKLQARTEKVVPEREERKEKKEELPKVLKKRIDSTQKISNYLLRAYISTFEPLYHEKTKKSYEIMHKDKIYWANGRFILGNTKDMESMSYPIIVNKADKTKLWDVDGNKYLDFAMGFGANFFGYNNNEIIRSVHSSLDHDIILGALRPETFQVAEEICKMTGVERVSFCNSGSEAVMNLLRIARAATGKNRVVAFKNSFHGTFDPIYTQADELGGKQALPKSIGTPIDYVSQTTLFDYGDEEIFDYLEDATDVAAVIVEPVQSRHPDFRPIEFVQKLRKITEELGILLIFDEVITGFRSGLGGAQHHFGVKADLVSYGKVIGGGFPIGVFGGKSIYMDLIDHKGWSEVSQKQSAFLVNTGGTFNAHPASIAAAKAVCTILQRDGEQLFLRMNHLADYIAETLNEWFKQQDIDIHVEHFCTLFIFVSNQIQLIRLLQYQLIYHNIYVWEGGTCFISTEHTKEDVDYLIDTVKLCCENMKGIFKPDFEKVYISPFVNVADSKRVMKLLSKNPGVEKIYPMTKQQIGVMTVNFNNRDQHQDVSFMRFCMKSKVNHEKISVCFVDAINHFEAFRSKWCWRGVSEPVILVLESVVSHVHFHAMKVTDEEFISSILVKRQSDGFNLANPPYIQLDIFESEEQVQESELLLTYYSSVVDGWSIDVFLNYFMCKYHEDKTNESTFRYDTYLQWIQDKDSLEKTEQFWQEYLSEITMKEVADTQQQVPEMVIEYWSLPKALSEPIDAIVDSINCSKASLLSYCYGCALNPKEETFISSTLTGRNPNLDRMLEAVGLFSYVVPIRIKHSADIFKDIKELDQTLKRMNQLVPFTVDDIEKVSGVSKEFLRDVLYNSGIVFLNQIGRNDWKDIEMVNDHGFLPVPLRSYVYLDKEITVMFTYDQLQYSEEKIKQLRECMEDMINQIADYVKKQ